MKKISLFLLGLLTIVPLVVSCSDDDDDDSKENVPDEPSLQGFPTQQTARDWTVGASHDYNILTAVMEGYLDEYYGEKGEFFNNYNKYTVEDGRSGTYARSPKVNFSEDMFLVSVHTYHYSLNDHSNGSSVENQGVQSWLEDENGKTYGADAYSYWCYGQAKKKCSCWNTFPMMKIPAGTYSVKCSNPKSWSYNSSSAGDGFAVIYAITL